MALGRFQRVENPLTIIAIFAGITEVASSACLPFLAETAQQTFVWFLVLFPFVLISAFFLTLNFNAKVLYAPGDYQDETHFLRAMHLSDSITQVSVTSPDEIVPRIELPSTRPESRIAGSPFEGISRAELDAMNEAFRHLGDGIRELLMKSGDVPGFSFGIVGEGLFKLSVFTNDPAEPLLDTWVLKVTTGTDGKQTLSLVGTKISSSIPADFASSVAKKIESTFRRFQAQHTK